LIVGEYFAGDHGAFAWQQHDRYDDAIWTILHGCQAHFDTAAYILDAPGVPDWSAQPCDHRVLQVAHDLLAATWRFRFDHAQLDLLDPAKPSVDAWLGWLEDEVAGWWRHHGLLRSVRISVDRQNTVAGYHAEASVAHRLLGLHDQVPWLESWRATIEEDHRATFEAACRIQP
jgi:hypothetical protein